MKKIILLSSCLLAGLFSRAQTFTSGHLSVTVVSGMSHDSAQCALYYSLYYNVTVDSAFPGEVVNLVDTNSGVLIATQTDTGTTGIWTFSFSPFTGDSYASDDPSGDLYWISTWAVFNEKITSATDTVFTQNITDSLPVTSPCNYNYVLCNVYIDNNANCMFDSGDIGLNGITIAITDAYSDSAATNMTYESSIYGSGVYYVTVQESWLDSVSISLPSWLAFIFPQSPCTDTTTFTFYQTSTPGVANFPLLCSGNLDVSCYGEAPDHIRYGRPLMFYPVVNNLGCDTVSGQLTVVLDSRVAYDSALSINPPSIRYGDTLIWNYSGLTSLSSISGVPYWNSMVSGLYLNLDSTAAIGDTLCFQVYTDVPPGDVDPANNYYSVCLPVVYSYDPNSKDVTPLGTGPNGYIPAGTDTLTYDIHFQNTGTDYAQNVMVIDTLDAHINPATFKIISANYNMTPQWLAPNVVAFNFNNIYLPDSGTNYAASQGELNFKAALLPALTPGTQIKNTAYVYFDTNPAIVTNTTINTIAMPNAVHQLQVYKAVNVYPNPATNCIYIDNLSGGTAYIMNIDGSLVLQQDTPTDKAMIDISALSPGVYIVKTVGTNGAATTKMVKY